MIIKKLRKTVLLITCLLAVSNSHAQKLSVPESDQMEKAQVMLDEKNYRLALPIFEGLLAKHPDDARLKYFTALCYISRPDRHAQMLQYLTDVYTVNKKADHIEFDLAKANYLNCKFDE